MAVASGVTTLVASKRPPRPTSRSASSTPARRKQAKRDGGRGLEKRRVRRQCAASSKLVDRIADDRRLPPKLVRWDGTPIDHEPFLERD